MNKLDQLFEARAKLDVLRDERERECAVVMEVVRPQLIAINERWKPLLTASTDAITALENEIKRDVLAAGATIKGAHLQAVWAKGRESWNAAALTGYAAAHPEIAQFRKVGEPSVSIREVA